MVVNRMSSFKTLKNFFIENKWPYILGILWLLAVDLLQLFVPEILRRFTDQMVANTATFQDLYRYGIYILLVGIGIAFFRFLWRMYINTISRKLEYELRNRLFFNLQGLSTQYFNKHKTGDLMAHATNDINAVRMALGPGIVMITDAFFITVVAVTMMIITTDYRLTFFALLPLPVLATIIGKFGKVVNHRFKSVQEAFSNLTDTVQENLMGIRVVKSYVQEDAEIDKFQDKNHRLFNENMLLVKLFGMFFPIVQFVSSISYLIVILYGGILVVYGQISLGDFIAFNTYLALLIWPMMAVGWVINVLQRGAASMDRINKILDAKPDIMDSPEAKAMNINGSITFDNVSFCYPDSKAYALKDFSMHIPAGKSLGVIGRTGSGKTTIVSVLLRLYDVDQGNIYIDDQAIKKIKLKSLREQIGYVDQDSFLFSTTIARNIAFGLDEFTQEEVERAAKSAQIHENIISFPKKYETFVGERGITLSGGQKQRVSIARALIKEPKILILDDSLSAVDTDTEEKILESLKRERKGKTSIIIAHRISTIKECDQIIVVDEGKILEQGVHEELLKNKQLYYELYQKQLLEEKILNE
jgi:ATP-binding cassette, subfamily B, multidrug efflux pump